MSSITIPTIWCDKDGVLAQYDYSIFEPEHNIPAPFLIRNAHVFRNLEPCENMCEAFRRLYNEVKDKSILQRTMSLRVLTAVYEGLTLSEHVIDSMAWCSKNLGLREKDFFATAVSKENVPLELKSEITKFDILLDDYNPNLRKWKAAGGTAIKVINGINSITDEFPYFYSHVNADYIVCLIQRIVRDVYDGKDLGTGQIAPNQKDYEEYKNRRERHES